MILQHDSFCMYSTDNSHSYIYTSNYNYDDTSMCTFQHTKYIPQINLLHGTNLMILLRYPVEANEKFLTESTRCYLNV